MTLQRTDSPLLAGFDRLRDMRRWTLNNRYPGSGAFEHAALLYTRDEILVSGTHRSRSGCSGSCASDPAGSPPYICTWPRRAALCRQSPGPPGSGRPCGRTRAARKRRSPTNAAPWSLASLARRFCNGRRVPFRRLSTSTSLQNARIRLRYKTTAPTRRILPKIPPFTLHILRIFSKIFLKGHVSENVT